MTEPRAVLSIGARSKTSLMSRDAKSQIPRRLLRLCGRGSLLSRIFVVADVLPLVDHANVGVVLLVIGVFQGLADVNVLAQVTAARREMQDALTARVDREPVLAVDLLTVGGEG